MGSKVVPWTGLMLFPWGPSPTLTVIPPGPIPEGARVLGVVVLLDHPSGNPGTRPPDQHPDGLPDHLPNLPPRTPPFPDQVNGRYQKPTDPTLSSLVELRPGLHLHPAARQVAVDGAPVDLTRREFDLLRFLATTPTVNIHVMRVRRKLGPHHCLALQTVRGVGYRWSP